MYMFKHFIRFVSDVFSISLLSLYLQGKKACKITKLDPDLSVKFVDESGKLYRLKFEK